MVKFSRFFAAIAVAVGVCSPGNGGGVSASSPVQTTFESLEATSPTSPTDNSTKGLTVEKTCVLADFQTATADFIALNKVVDTVRNTPKLLKPYISDPLNITNYKMPTMNITFLGHKFETTIMIHSLNMTGLSTIKPMPVNVTSSNTLNMGVRFNGTIALNGSFTVDVSQLNHKWYQFCWVNLLHPFQCKPNRYKVAVAVIVRKPKIVAQLKAVMYQCASGIPTSACQNLTIPKIMAEASSGNFTGVSALIFKNFKDARINTLTLGWDLISNFTLDFYNSIDLVRASGLGFGYAARDKLNGEGYFHRRHVEVTQSLFLAMMNKFIDKFKSLFGATCL